MTCAYAVRGALKKLKGVESVEVSLNKGLAEVKLKPGNTLQPEDFWNAVRNNGFTPKLTKVLARGRIDGRGSGRLVFSSGSNSHELKGGSQVIDEARRLIGKTVEVEGSMTPAKATGTAPVPLEAVSVKVTP